MIWNFAPAVIKVVRLTVLLYLKVGTRAQHFSQDIVGLQKRFKTLWLKSLRAQLVMTCKQPFKFGPV